MLNEHKRWNPQLEQYYKGVNKTPSYRPKMMLDITGRYVLESDYAALLYRIEELEAKTRLQGIKATLNREVAIRDERIWVLEGKLAKALEMALDECGFRDGTNSYDNWWQERRASVAALKGEK